MIEPVIRTILAGALADKVGDRVYLGAGPQDERRARIVLTLLTSTLPQCFDGPGGYRYGTIQASCLAPDYRAATELADAVAAALNGFAGPAPSGVVLHYVEPTEIEDIQRETFEGKGLPTFGKAVPIDFQHEG
jgi:hypothetical protein